MFWKKKDKEEGAVDPVEQGAPAIAEQPEAMVAAAPEELATDQTGAEPIPAPLVREPLVAADDVPIASDILPDIQTAQLEGRIIEAISTIFDPEIPVNIYELGLIYDLSITADNCVKVDMTLTSPACPVAGSLPGEVEQKVREVDGVQDVALELVWDPPWTPDRMSEAARLELGFM
jgi:FeS assembly SUF system protein